MNKHFALISTLVWLAALPATAIAGCPPEGMDRAQLLNLKEEGFEIGDAQQRNRLAMALLGCVGDPDPLIRDGVVYEGYATWLRAGALETGTVHEMAENLAALLTNPDKDGFLAPFAALDLSEVVRTDRINPHFSDAQRAGLIRIAAEYLASVSDYRGYTDGEGWRHGVAHGADLVLQWILNPAVTREQQGELLNAVAAQVSAGGRVSYVFGEPERLARPAYYAYRRGDLDDAFWERWFADVSSPQPLDGWSDAWASERGLALRHNTLAFLGALHLMASSADDGRAAGLAALSLNAIKRLY